MNFFVSVVIPTYNREKVISQAIGSVINQTYENWELLVIDDASTDNTELLIKNNRDKRIKYFCLPENKGNAAARNFGIQQSFGDYIVFLDSDDKMEPECLDTFRKLVQRDPRVKFAFGDHQVYNQNSGEIKISQWQPNPQKSILEELKIGTGCGIMVRKDCFIEVGLFDERLRIAVDTDWLIRLNKKVSYHYIPKVLVTVIKHSDERVRNNKSELIKSYEIILQKNKLSIFKNIKLIQKFLYKLQWLNYHEGNLEVGNKYAYKLINEKIYDMKSIVTFFIFNLLPKSLGKRIHLFVSGGNKI